MSGFPDVVCFCCLSDKCASRKDSLCKQLKRTVTGFCPDPAPETNSRTGISFFQGGTNEINLIAMHNIINYELNGQKRGRIEVPLH